MRRALLVGAGATAAFIGVLLVRAVSATSTQLDVPPSTLVVDAPAMAVHLGEAVRFATVAAPDRIDPAVFEGLHAYAAATWPSFYAATRGERFAGLSELRTWTGTRPDLPPVMLLAHLDVVPVEDATEKDWTEPPFSGRVAPCVDVPGDCVWGRGAIDMKAAWVGMMESADALAAAGWRPERTILFGFGHDEEVGGSGNAAIAAGLRARGVRLAWLLDEGVVITDGLIAGAPAPVALLGVAEKGYLSLEIAAQGDGGHSSMPPPHTAAGLVARAVTRLEDDPFDAAIDGPAAMMFDALAPEFPFGQRLALTNRWLLGGVVTRKLIQKPTTNALVRTTQAVTMLSGSPQDNVLPQHATAVVNFRIHPRDSVDSVIARVTSVIDDPSVTVSPVRTGLFSEPSPISSVSGPGYAAIARAIRAAAPEALVAPGMMIAATDSRSYLDLADDVYRFQPYWMTPSDRSRIHGTDERVTVENIVHYLRFYDALLRAAGQPDPLPG